MNFIQQQQHNNNNGYDNNNNNYYYLASIKGVGILKKLTDFTLLTKTGARN
jgi:hypothetical protein